jgi:hypothetical protein
MSPINFPQFKVERVPAMKSGIGKKPVKMPVDILLGLPTYVTKGMNIDDAFNLPGALSDLLVSHPEVAPQVVKPHIWAPEFDLNHLERFIEKPFLTLASTKQLYKPARLQVAEFPGQNPDVVKRGRPANYEIVHFYGRLDQRGELVLQDQGDIADETGAVDTEALARALMRARTRLLILDLLDLQDYDAARSLSQHLATTSGMAVLVVFAMSRMARESYFLDLYGNILHNRPLVEMVTPSNKCKNEVAVNLTGPENADDLLSFNRWMDEMTEALAEQKDHIRHFCDTVTTTTNQYSPVLHQTQVDRLFGSAAGGAEHSMAQVKEYQETLSQIRDQPWDHESDGAVILPGIHTGLAEVAHAASTAEASLPGNEDILVELKNAPRALNADFVDVGNNRPLKTNEALVSSQEYDLMVDIGPLWDKTPNIVLGFREFPEDNIAHYLSGKERKAGWFDVQVVLASEDFDPGIVSGTMRVPILPTGRSIPYINGKPGKAEDQLKLRLRAPSVSAKKQTLRAHGRLCVYHKNNLLQAANVNVGVSHLPGYYSDVPNEIRVDYSLATGFLNVKKNFGKRRIDFGDEKGSRPVEIVNFMMNDDGDGQHRILIQSDLESGKESKSIAAWKTFDPASKKIERLIKQTQDALIACYDNLTATWGKPFNRFVKDLENLAVIGDELRCLALDDLMVDETGMTSPVWVKAFLQNLSTGKLLQVARTRQAKYIFPWALIYQYRLQVEPSAFRHCDILKEWDKNGLRQKNSFADCCPYEQEAWHKENVLCPYGFWGIKHIVEQPLSRLVKQGGGWKLPEGDNKAINVKGAPILSIAATNDAVINARDAHFSKLESLLQATRKPVEPADDRNSVLSMLKAPEIVYFFCHGDKDGDGDLYLSIGNRDQKLEHDIYPETLMKWSENDLDLDAWSENGPFVFLNGCGTAQADSIIDLNFIVEFSELGAVGLIGTEVSVQEGLAYLIAEKIITHMGERTPIGAAVRKMRWELLNQGNVLGLVYTPYCLAELAIKSKQE